MIVEKKVFSSISPSVNALNNKNLTSLVRFLLFNMLKCKNSSSPSRARTYNPAVNSRVLYH